MKILILDDNKERHSSFRRSLIGHSLTHTSTIEGCVNALKHETFDAVFLDHDLDGKVYVKPGPTTGYAVAEWLSKNKDRMPGTVVLHSLHDEGREAMASLLPEAKQIPFAWIPAVLIIDGKDISKNEAIDL
jgi:CheY-like chemotaxis protein